MLSTTTVPELREVLKQGSVSQTEIAIDTVNIQLKLWEEALQKEASNTVTCKILGLDVARLEFKGYLGQHVEEDVKVIIKGVHAAGNDELLKKGIWSWSKLPYAMNRVGKSLPSEGTSKNPRKKTKVLENDEIVDDIDEWFVCFSALEELHLSYPYRVLRNEAFLRTLSKGHSDTVCPETVVGRSSTNRGPSQVVIQFFRRHYTEGARRSCAEGFAFLYR